jgi:hypothetical protein
MYFMIKYIDRIHKCYYNSNKYLYKFIWPIFHIFQNYLILEFSQKEVIFIYKKERNIDFTILDLSQCVFLQTVVFIVNYIGKIIKSKVKFIPLSSSIVPTTFCGEKARVP